MRINLLIAVIIASIQSILTDHLRGTNFVFKSKNWEKKSPIKKICKLIQTKSKKIIEITNVCENAHRKPNQWSASTTSRSNTTRCSLAIASTAHSIKPTALGRIV